MPFLEVILYFSHCLSVILSLCVSVSLSLCLSQSLIFHGTHSNNIDSILAEGFKMDAVLRYHPKGELLCSSYYRSVIMSLCISVSLYLWLYISLISHLSLSLMFHWTHSTNIDSILAEGFKMDAVPKDRPKGEFLCLPHCLSVILSLFVSVSLNLCLSISLTSHISFSVSNVSRNSLR